MTIPDNAYPGVIWAIERVGLDHIIKCIDHQYGIELSSWISGRSSRELLKFAEPCLRDELPNDTLSEMHRLMRVLYQRVPSLRRGRIVLAHLVTDGLGEDDMKTKFESNDFPGVRWSLEDDGSGILFQLTAEMDVDGGYVTGGVEIDGYVVLDDEAMRGKMDEVYENILRRKGLGIIFEKAGGCDIEDMAGNIS